MSEQTTDLRETVRRRYAAAAVKVTEGGSACCGPEPVEVDENFGSPAAQPWLLHPGRTGHRHLHDGGGSQGRLRVRLPELTSPCGTATARGQRWAWARASGPGPGREKSGPRERVRKTTRRPRFRGRDRQSTTWMAGSRRVRPSSIHPPRTSSSLGAAHAQGAVPPLDRGAGQPCRRCSPTASTCAAVPVRTPRRWAGR